VRTYAPCGQGVTLRHVETHDHLSVMSGITMAGRLFTRLRDKALTGVDSVGFLFSLVQHLGSVVVIWDGSPIHRGNEVREFLAGGGARHIHLEPLPPYAPDLNPDESVWQHLKHVEMRNLCCHDLTELRYELRLAVMRLRAKSHIIRSFFEEAGLVIENLT
jgi:transposase